MILIDANLLIYATNSDAPRHAAARAWLDETLSGVTPVGLPWVCVLAFLRIMTSSRIFDRPMPVDDAIDRVGAWLDQPFVDAIVPGERHWPILRNLLRTTGMAGNLTTDAHVAAMAIEHGATVYSADHDFKRFPGVDHVDPLN